MSERIIHPLVWNLGKLLVQLKPLGGTFGIISSGAPNAMQKAQGARDRLEGTEWKEAQESPKDCQGSIDLFYQQMWEYAADPDIGAIIPTGAWPFLDSNTTRWTTFRDAHPNITMVVSETLPITMELMNKGYVDGIVGQLPFEMGELSVDTLLRIYEGRRRSREYLRHFLYGSLVVSARTSTACCGHELSWVILQFSAISCMGSLSFARLVLQRGRLSIRIREW